MRMPTVFKAGCFFVQLIILCFSASIAHAERVAVLIKFEPYKTNGTKWDTGKGADPVLCLPHGCYKSKGLRKGAKYYPGKKIFLPAVINRHCRNSLQCIFRDIELHDGLTEVWPVDLDGFRHDHLEHRLVQSDESCLSSGGELYCLNGIFTEEYSMWIIPERIITKVKLGELDEALYTGLDKTKEDYMHSYLSQAHEDIPHLVSKFYELIVGDEVPKHCATNLDATYKAFEMAGLFLNQNSHVLYLFKEYLQNSDRKTFIELSKNSPKTFWKFHKMLQDMADYVKADHAKVVKDSYFHAVKLHAEENSVKLLVSKKTKAYANEMIEECIHDTAYTKERKPEIIDK